MKLIELSPRSYFEYAWKKVITTVVLSAGMRLPVNKVYDDFTERVKSSIVECCNAIT